MIKNSNFDDKFLIRIKLCFIFFSITFLLVFSLIYFYNFLLFIAISPFVLSCYVYLSFICIQFFKKRNLIFKQLFFDFKLKNKEDFEKLPIPLMVCSEKGLVLWRNKYLNAIVKSEKCNIGENFFSSFKISEKNLKKTTNKNLKKIKLEGMEFNLYINFLPGSSVYLLYFQDISDFVSLKEKYDSSRPCVFYIMVDNFKEILANKKDSEKSVLIGKIDNIIEEFVDEYLGFMQKFRENEFLVVLEIRHLKNICDAKFEILKNVRRITEDENFYLTLSIGVGAYGEDLKECSKFALEALDMALGRGGDQAAIKTPSNFEFYGGNSKGVERYTRVRTRVIAKSLLKLIHDADNVIIMGHKFGDLDSVGSAIVLASTIRKMRKKSYVVLNEKQTLAIKLINKIKENGYFDGIIEEEEAFKLLEFNTLLIIVDTHNPNFLESYELYENCKNVVIIDHHRKMVDCIKDAVIFYHEPYASSTCELVCELIQYFGDEFKLKPFEAEALLCGIILDTKNFTVKVGVRTFEAAGYLKRFGADTVSAGKFFSNSLELYKKKVQIVVNAKIYKGCAISQTDLTTKEVKIICPQAADELLKIVNIEASFVIYKLNDLICVTARSLGKFNVQVIMEYLGGGGHQLQAACQVKDSNIESVKQMLLKAIDKWLF